MNKWIILGIDSTDDIKTIKKAYRNKLKVTRPEMDPEEFMELRTAYEEAMAYAENCEENAYDDYEQEVYSGENYDLQLYMDEKTELDYWIERLHKLYSDYDRRNTVKEWRKILCEDIPFRIEYYQKCRLYIYNQFFKSGPSIYLPREVRLFIDEFFEFSTTPAQRAKEENVEWARYLNKKIKLCENIEFDKLINYAADAEDIDYFYLKYETLIEELQKYGSNEEYDGDIEEDISLLKAFKLSYLPFECIYTALKFSEYSQQQLEERISELTDKFGKAVEIELLQVEYYIYNNRYEHAREQLSRLYMIVPEKNYVAIYQMAVCCMKVGMLYQAYMLVKMLTWLNPKPFMHDMAEKIYHTMEEIYLENIDNGGEISDIEHIRMCRMYLRSGREEEAVKVLERVKEPSGNLWEYEVAHFQCVLYEEAKFVKPDNLFDSSPPFNPILPIEIKGAEAIFNILNSYPVEKLNAIDRLELQELKGRYLFEQRKFHECETFCNEILEEYPMSYTILMLRGYMDYCKNSKGYHDKRKEYIDFDYLIDVMPNRIEARLVCSMSMAFCHNFEDSLEVLEPVKERVSDHYTYFTFLKYRFSSNKNEIINFTEGVKRLFKESRERKLTIPAVSKYKLLDLNSIYIEGCLNGWVIKDETERKHYFEFMEELQSSKYNHPEHYIDMYNLYENSGRYREAINILEEQLKTETMDSKIQNIYRCMVSMYTHLEEMDKAEKYLEMVREEDREILYSEMGAGYYFTGDYEKAIDYRLASINISSGNMGDYYWLGNSYRELGKLDEAIKAYNDGIRVCNKTGDFGLNTNLYLRIYCIYEQQEKWDNALAVIELMHKNSKVEYFNRDMYLYVKGFIYWAVDKNGEYANEIIEAWSKGVAYRISFNDMYGRLASVYKSIGDVESAIATLKTGIEVFSDCGDYFEDNMYDDLYWLYLSKKEFEECVNIAKQIPHHSKNEIIQKKALHKIALAYMLNEDYEPAYEYYLKARDEKDKIYSQKDIDSGLPDSDVFVCCYLMGRYEEAYTLAKSLAFDYGEANISFMFSALRSKFMDSSTVDMELAHIMERYLLDVLETDGENGEYLSDLSELYMAMGNEKLSDDYRNRAYGHYEKTGEDNKYSICVMEAWRWGYKKEYSKAFEAISQYEACKSVETGNSTYGEYCFFRKKGENHGR